MQPKLSLKEPGLSDKSVRTAKDVYCFFVETQSYLEDRE